jgi:hypothetical protein
MTKHLTILLALIAVIVFYGCGDGGTSINYFTFVIQPGDTGKDATIIDDVGPSDYNYGTVNWLALEEGESGYIGPVKSQILIQWDLSELPSNAVVVNAKMEIFVVTAWLTYFGDEDVENAAGDLVCVLIAENWDEATVTWDGRPAVNEKTKTLCGKPPASDYWERRWWSADVTDFVRAWHSGDFPNYGLCLRLDGTDLGDFGHYRAEFASSEAVLESGANPKANCIWPKLVITYTIG